MQKGQISVQTENIFPIIKQYLYSDQEIFLRELISNAVDATSKLKTLAAKGEYKGDLGDLTIQIKLDPKKKTITIADRGIGMSEAEVKKYLNEVAFSSAHAFLEKYQADANIIGHFGLGFYSAFMVSKKVDVVTRSHKKSVKGVTWSCTGSPEYTIDQNDRKDRGTDIVLHVSDDSEEYLKESRIQELLDKYCKFLPISIQFGVKTETSYEGEGEDRKEIKTEVANVINNPDPAWKKTPRSLKEDDYKAFYNELYPHSTPPLFWIHLNIDYPFNLTGVLYFPKINNSLEVQKNKIQLYSNQVYVTDEVKEIVPEFLTLLHGVIDSPDIPLNVSRSYLQSDQNVKKITNYITKKVADKLSQLFKKKREDYESKWKDISVFVKYGMLSEDKFYDKAVKFALLTNVEGKHHTIEEYQEKIKATQTDKYDKQVFLYTNNPKEHDSYIKSATNYGYDVLLMEDVLDNHYVQHLEQKLGNITFVRVDSDTADNLVQKDETKESVLSEKEQGRVKEIFTNKLGEKQNQLVMKALSPEDHPVLITKPEFMRRMMEMQNLQGMNTGMGDFEHYNIVVNTNHPLIAEKLLRMKGQDRKESFASYLIDLARLNQNMLKGEELTKFIGKSLEFVQ